MKIRSWTIALLAGLTLVAVSALAIPTLNKGTGVTDRQLLLLPDNATGTASVSWKYFGDAWILPADGASDPSASSDPTAMGHDVSGPILGSTYAVAASYNGADVSDSYLVRDRVFAVVPEPYTLSLFGLGLLGLGAYRRMRRRS